MTATVTVTEVLAPCPGRLVAMADTPDPVFAAEMVGPGVAIDPELHEVTVVSPIAGEAVRVMPHAFVILGTQGVGVLVHLGINTVRLDGQGFEMLTEQGATVEAGTPMVRWDPSTIHGDNISTMVLVIALDRPEGSVEAPEPGSVAAIGDLLYTVMS